MKFCSIIFSTFLLAICSSFNGSAQNSVLVNFGSSSCNSSSVPSFSLIKNPITAGTALITNCSMSSQLPDFYSVFVAYNPKNNKLYIADVRSGIDTKIWVLDIGLPTNINCPISIPVTPTYSYNYVSNNFEFDNNGDLWSLSNFNSTNGTCNLEKFDVNTGQIINTRVLQFPVGNFPNTISSGDVCILPNGRMFATLGSGPSRLYEIINYNGTTAATSNYLGTLPKDCYGIAFINGILELTGNDFIGSCYYFEYDIATGVLGPQKTFQVGNSPIDNTSFTPAIGCTKRLLNSTFINATTADLTYEVYAENMGNVILNNINVSDDLAAAFGATNVSNVSVNFITGSNTAGLVLNAAYNGITNKNLLLPGQNLPNKLFNNKNFYFKALIKCRASNLTPNTIYLNRAISTANIGATGNLSFVNVTDSSNNGDSTLVDPNLNGNAGNIGENNPTPFSLGIVPVKFIGVSAAYDNTNNVLVSWQVATPTTNAHFFEVEYSLNGLNWQTLQQLSITSPTTSGYQFSHNNVPLGKLFYRIKQVDVDGKFIYSNTVFVRRKGNQGFYIYPNPANTVINIQTDLNNAGEKGSIILFDATGRKIVQANLQNAFTQIYVADLPNGTYILQLINDNEVISKKITVNHQ
jgi:hypothetical protein